MLCEDWGDVRFQSHRFVVLLCVSLIDLSAEADIYAIRTQHMDMSASEFYSSQWNAYKSAAESDESTRIFTLKGKRLCISSYCAITGVHLKQGTACQNSTSY